MGNLWHECERIHTLCIECVALYFPVQRDYNGCMKRYAVLIGLALHCVSLSASWEREVLCSAKTLSQRFSLLRKTWRLQNDLTRKVARIAVVDRREQVSLRLRSAAHMLGGRAHIIDFHDMMQDPASVHGLLLTGWRLACLDKAYTRRVRALHEACLRRIPVLGVCFGMQVMVNHIFYNDGEFVRKNETQDAFMTAQMPMGSMHYFAPLETQDWSHVGQACKGLGAQFFHHRFGLRPFVVAECAKQGFRPTAYRPDGVVAAIENPNHLFCVGVLFHPERDISCQVHPLITRFMQAAFIHASLLR